MPIKSSARKLESVKAPKKAVPNQTVWEAAKAGAIAALKESIADCEGLIKDGPLPKASPSPCWSRKPPKKGEDAEIVLEVGIKSGTTWVPDVHGDGEDKARFVPAEALQWMKDALAEVEAMSSKDDSEEARKLHGAVLKAKKNAQDSRNAAPPTINKRTGQPNVKVIKKYNPSTDKFEAV